MIFNSFLKIFKLTTLLSRLIRVNSTYAKQVLKCFFDLNDKNN